jgi:hypothetical protein
LLLSLLTVVSWWAWFGWHDLKGDDGDYQAWQAVGCVVSLLALGFLAPRVVHPFLAGLTMTVSFTIAVGADWIPEDESGLAGVGVLMLGMGLAVGALLVLPLADALWRSHADRAAR